MNSSRETISSTLRKRVVDLRLLSPSMRVLIIFGYACVAAALGATLYLEFTVRGSGGVEYPYTEGGLVRTPVEVMVISSIALSLGWAFFLAGASDCRRRIFIPIGLLFAAQWILFSPIEGDWAILPGLGGLLLVLGAIGAHLVSSRSTYWRELPVLEFAAWLTLMLVSVLWLFLLQSREETAIGLDLALSFPQVLSIPFWLLLGVEATDIGITLARYVTVRLQRVLPGIRRVSLALLGWLGIRAFAFSALVVASGEEDNFVGFWGVSELLVSLALLAAALVLTIPMLAGILGRRTIVTLLTLSLSTPIATLGMTTALLPNLDPLGGALTAIGVGAGILPAALLFVGVAAYDVMNFGIRYANVDGRLMPRTGRVLMYFGAVLLVAAYVMFYLNTEVVRTGEPHESLSLLIDVPFMAGVVFLGVPYLLWVLIRRPDRFAGE